MRAKWVMHALMHLDLEATRIAKQNPVAARAYVNRIFEGVADLRAQPRLGRPGRVAGTRELPIPEIDRVIPYRLRNESIEILRILPGSRS